MRRAGRPEGRVHGECRMLGVRASEAGRGCTTRGLGFKAAELDVVLEAVAASRVFEQQPGPP